MNILNVTQAIQLINEVETATGRYAKRAPAKVAITIDENGVAYICARDDMNCLYAKADVRKYGREQLTAWIVGG